MRILSPSAWTSFAHPTTQSPCSHRQGVAVSGSDPGSGLDPDSIRSVDPYQDPGGQKVLKKVKTISCNHLTMLDPDPYQMNTDPAAENGSDPDLALEILNKFETTLKNLSA